MRYVNRGLYVILALSLALVLASIAHTAARAEEPNRVGLVVDFGDGSLTTQCIEFDETKISGYDVLRRSGLSLVVQEVSGMGVTVCDIEGTSGCPASSCFCQCQGMACLYWRYYYLSDDSWQYAAMGAAARSVEQGDVEGWAWGDENASGGPPPVIAFDQICPEDDGPTSPELSASPTGSPVPDATTSTSTGTPAAGTPSSPASSPTPVANATEPPPPASVGATTAPPETDGPQATASEPADQSPADGTESTSLYPAAGYAAFGVIALGLLGWFIFAARGSE